VDDLRVLIVEDEPSVRIDVRDALRRFGPELFEASNTEEARIFLGRVAFDVLILSMELPDNSSKEFLETLPDLLHTPYEVVLLTSSRESRLRESYFELGISHLLMKPIDYQHLGYVVRNASMVRARLRYLEEATLGEVDEANQRVDAAENELTGFSRKLEQLDTHLGSLSSLGHDFRTPLQVIVGFSELLLGTHLSTEQLEWTESIRRSGSEILRLVQDFLALQRSPETAIEKQSTVVNVEKLFSNQVQMSRVLVGEKKISLVLDYEPETPKTVLIDEALLRRVVQNLLSNAIKFTHEGIITLRAEGRQVGQNAHLMFSVCDSGQGLGLELQEKVFEPGVQAPGAGAGSGYGLGLSVCREIVESMGGKIGVESELGKGSRFWFKLKVPVVEDSPSQAKPEVAPVQVKQPKVLVADDDVMSQKLVRRLLSQMGFGVELVQNGHDALLAMMHQEFDAVIMDCDMPVMNGFEATRLIREKETETEATRITPIIALTGHAESDDRAAFRAAGATAHVTKPVAVSELEAILREHISGESSSG